MNHRTYDGQRFSPLAGINKGNVKGLRLAYAVPLGGLGGNEWNEPTPLVENGFLYISDSWGVLYKIDGTSGDVGRIVWRVDPKQEKQGTNRGAAFWRNLVISPANWPARIIATDKETGKVVWETNMVFGQAETRITVVDRSQLDQDLRYIALGKEEGAKLHWGGEVLNRDNPGFYLQPTLFTEVDNRMRIAREEIFGPVAGLIRVKDYDEAVAVAKQNPFRVFA